MAGVLPGICIIPEPISIFFVNAEKYARKHHVPCIVHVKELTQPQGHTTSGSHERYKSKERLEWERNNDCLKMMRKWILENQIADENELDEKKLNYFNSLIFERSRGKPIAYLTYKKNFWKYEFRVEKDILIPRPDTEILVEQALKITRNKSKLRVLDIGIGSGCILLSIMKEKILFLYISS